MIYNFLAICNSFYLLKVLNGSVDLIRYNRNLLLVLTHRAQTIINTIINESRLTRLGFLVTF